MRVKFHKSNLNKGTEDGKRLVDKSIEKFGMRDVVIVDKEGEIISGNHRKRAANKQGIKSERIVKANNDEVIVIQYDDIDLTTPEGKELALALNQTSYKNVNIDAELAAKELPIEVLQEWQIQLIEPKAVEIDPIVSNNDPEGKEIGQEGLGYEDEGLGKFITPDILYPTNNPFDIPVLDIDLAAEHIEVPFIGWGSESRTNKNIGTYHFYVDDYRFNAIFDDPSKVINSGCRSIIEPNISLFDTTPIAYGLSLIYKKRWMSRYFQSRGITVFADLNVSKKFYEYNQLGIPQGYNAFATRGYAERTNDLLHEYEIAKSISGKKQPNFVVYGGGKNVEELCMKNNILYIVDFINAKKIGNE